MKKTKTFSVEEAIYESFDKMSDEKFLNKSQWIESKIQEYIEHNTFKDTFGANDVLGKITDKISEFIEEDDYIQNQLAKVADKSNLLVSLKMDSNFHRLEIKLEPKYPFDPKTTYTSPIDDERVTIVDSTLNYIILSNGNKLRVKDFQRLYSPVIDPDRFLNGDMSIAECMTDVIKKSDGRPEARFEVRPKRQVVPVDSLPWQNYGIFGVEESTDDVINEVKVEKIDQQQFFNKGSEGLFGIASKLMQIPTDEFTESGNWPKSSRFEDVSEQLKRASEGLNIREKTPVSNVDSTELEGITYLKHIKDRSKVIPPSAIKTTPDIIKEGFTHLQYVLDKQNEKTINDYIEKKSKEFNKDGTPTEFNMEKDGLVGQIRPVDINDAIKLQSIGMDSEKLQKARNSFDEALEAGGCTEEIPDDINPSNYEQIDEDYPTYMSEEERDRMMEKFINGEGLTGPKEE